MEDYIMTVIKKASVFMILAQAFIQFRPSPSYEKYFKFLVGIMTTVILIVPILELFQKGTMEQYRKSMASYMEELQIISEQELPNAVSPDDTYFDVMNEEVKTKLNNSLSESGYTVKTLEIMPGSAEDERNSEAGVKVCLIPATAGISKIRVEKIETSHAEENGAEENVEEENMQREIAEMLGLEAEAVEVEIVGG